MALSRQAAGDGKKSKGRSPEQEEPVENPEASQGDGTNGCGAMVEVEELVTQIG